MEFNLQNNVSISSHLINTSIVNDKRIIYNQYDSIYDTFSINYCIKTYHKKKALYHARRLAHANEIHMKSNNASKAKKIHMLIQSKLKDDKNQYQDHIIAYDKEKLNCAHIYDQYHNKFQCYINNVQCIPLWNMWDSPVFIHV